MKFLTSQIWWNCLQPTNLAASSVWKNVYLSASKLFRVKSVCGLFVSKPSLSVVFLFFLTNATSKLSQYKLFITKIPSSLKNQATQLIFDFVMKLLTSQIWWNCLQPINLAASSVWKNVYLSASKLFSVKSVTVSATNRRLCN